MARFALLHPNTVPVEPIRRRHPWQLLALASGGAPSKRPAAQTIAIRGSEKSPIADGSNALSGPAHDTSTKTSQKASPPPASRPFAFELEEEPARRRAFRRGDRRRHRAWRPEVTAAIKWGDPGRGDWLRSARSRHGRRRRRRSARRGHPRRYGGRGAHRGPWPEWPGTAWRKRPKAPPRRLDTRPARSPLRLTHRSKADKGQRWLAAGKW